MKRFLRHIKVIVLRRVMKIFSTVQAGKTSQKHAAHIHFRREPVKFFGLHGFEGISLLFLTDPHIGGNIDKIVHETSYALLMLLANTTPETTLILHGGDFMSSDGDKQSLSFKNFTHVAERLFAGLGGYKHFAVIGNHDEKNSDFVFTQKWLEEKYQIHFMTEPRHTKKIFIDDKSIGIHGLHTLSHHLHRMPKKERNMILDQYIYILDHTHTDVNIVLLHNPDGLEFLLARLKSTKQKITTPTLFLAGHTHGGMFDIPFFRKLGLFICNTGFGRYKGWYYPQGKYAQTGNWKLYVSTGMGNSPGFDFRMNADPEVVLFTL